MRELAKQLLTTIRKQQFMSAGERVAVAVSGGADSVALLLLLAELRGELGIVLSVAHVNHRLRGEESDQDEEFVAKLAVEKGLELVTETAPVKARGSGIEAAARKLRYEFFRKLACNQGIAKVAMAHTLDDQAETVLLRMFRGTGIRGLAGILPRLRLEDESRLCGEVVRPMLGIRRAELREYLRARGQQWREDSSNRDLEFLRNRLRERIIPLIAKEFGEASLEHLAELAEIARAEEESLHQQVSSTPKTLSAEALLGVPLAAARRGVRGWIEANAPGAGISFRLVEEILDLARGEVGREIELPGRSVNGEPESSDAGGDGEQIIDGKSLIVRRERKELVIVSGEEGRDYEYQLEVPGEVFVTEMGVRIVAEAVMVEEVEERDRQGLLDARRVGSALTIRNWRAGDRYWPAHTGKEKKVKELLTDRHATGRQKKLWPAAVCRGELVWMRGFAVPEAWRARSGEAVMIREMPAGATDSRRQ